MSDLAGARGAGDALLAKGAGTALITLGERGALFHGRDRSLHVPLFATGKVVETAGAGGAFVGGFAAALAGGADPLEAARFGLATAGIYAIGFGVALALNAHFGRTAVSRGLAAAHAGAQLSVPDTTSKNQCHMRTTSPLRTLASAARTMPSELIAAS
ncbi:PfkB family carbohydrate kinase [Bradyrhizobium sp. RDM12]